MEAVDAFIANWVVNNSRGPLVALFPELLHMHNSVVLVDPECPRMADVPILTGFTLHGMQFAYFMVDMQEPSLSELHVLILPGLSGFTLFHGKMPNTRVLALHCDVADFKP